MRVLEVLAEVVCTEELLARVALAELVHLLEVAYALLPVLVRRRTHRDASAGRSRSDGRPAAVVVLAAVAARVGLARMGRALVECTVVALQGRTRPAVSPHMQAILMPLHFVLVLEAVAAEGALVLLLCLMSAVVFLMSDPVKSDDD